MPRLQPPMPRLRLPRSSLAVLASLSAQGPEGAALDPVQLVASAEKLCAGAERETGVLLLWDGLEQMLGLAESPARTAAMQAARALLKTHDPLHADRLAAFTAIAKAQAELATSYRLKKWFDAAAERLDFAERFDRELANRERAQLAGVRPKGAPVPHEIVAFDPADLAAERDTLILRAEALLAAFPQGKVRYDPAKAGWVAKK